MARKIGKPAAPTPVEAVRHTGDSRANIPTAELAVASPRRRDRGRRRCATRATRRSTRSSSGRARTSRTARTSRFRRSRSTSRRQIDPQALVEDLRADERGPTRRAAARPLPPTSTDLTFEEQVDFYRHAEQLVEPDDPRRLAAGDDQPGREGGPQGPGPDDLRRPALRDQVRHQLAGLARASATSRTARPRTLTRQPEQVRAFRDTWELGIHSYLSVPARPARRRPRAADRVRLASSSRSATRTCTSFGALLDEVFGARELRVA